MLKMGELSYNGPRSEFHDCFWQNYVARSANAFEIAHSVEAVYIGRAINVALNSKEYIKSLSIDEAKKLLQDAGIYNEKGELTDDYI